MRNPSTDSDTGPRRLRARVRISTAVQYPYLLRKIDMTSNFEFILSQNSIQQLIKILNSTCNRIQNSEISQQTRSAGTMQDASSETITRATAADHARDWRIMQPTWAL